MFIHSSIICAACTDPAYIIELDSGSLLHRAWLIYHTCQPSRFYRDYPAKRALIPASRHEVQNSRFLHMRHSLAYAALASVSQAVFCGGGKKRPLLYWERDYTGEARARRGTPCALDRGAAALNTYLSIVDRTTTVLYILLYIDDQDLIGCTSAIFM